MVRKFFLKEKLIFYYSKDIKFINSDFFQFAQKY